MKKELMELVKRNLELDKEMSATDFDTAEYGELLEKAAAVDEEVLENGFDGIFNDVVSSFRAGNETVHIYSFNRGYRTHLDMLLSDLKNAGISTFTVSDLSGESVVDLMACGFTVVEKCEVYYDRAARKAGKMDKAIKFEIK